MREIKFKIYSKITYDDKENKWLYLTLNNLMVNNPTLIEKFNDCIMRGSKWLQYTGLKDKNGVEIFEGDLIIQQDYTEPLEVYFCEDCCACFRARLNGFANIERIRGGECEIIGNVYNNPELLK